MRGTLVRRRFALLAAMVLAAMCLGLVEESFFHTDDGCPVETHCLACRLATGTVAVLAAALPAIERADVRVERVWTISVQVRGAATVSITPSRAPPLV